MSFANLPGGMLRVAGIDTSLTSTGVAVALISEAGTVVDRVTRTVVSKGAKGDSLDARYRRLRVLVARIVDVAGGSDLVVIESPAHSRVTGSHHDRSGLWWLLIQDLRECSLASVVEVSPSGRAKYISGKGNAAKDAVLAAAIRRWPEWDIAGNDVADAVGLLSMGCRSLGYPIETSMPAANLTAMTPVRWPTSQETSTA
ncbi:MAG: hypothetical protein KA249_12965 [Dermatophilaceae bacterium]|nr:hypothetical protein [Dermatophilaceae bacterium]